MQTRRIVKSIDVIPIGAPVTPPTRSDKVRVSMLINKPLRPKQKQRTKAKGVNTQKPPPRVFKQTTHSLGKSNALPITKHVASNTPSKSPPQEEEAQEEEEEEAQEEEVVLPPLATTGGTGTVSSDVPTYGSTINFNTPSSEKHTTGESEVEEFLDFNKPPAAVRPQTPNTTAQFITTPIGTHLQTNLEHFGISIERFMLEMGEIEEQISANHTESLAQVNTHFNNLRVEHQRLISELINGLRKHLQEGVQVFHSSNEN